jgi:hypothetical protein
MDEARLRDVARSSCRVSASFRSSPACERTTRAWCPCSTGGQSHPDRARSRERREDPRGSAPPWRPFRSGACPPAPSRSIHTWHTDTAPGACTASATAPRCRRRSHDEPGSRDTSDRFPRRCSLGSPVTPGLRARTMVRSGEIMAPAAAADKSGNRDSLSGKTWIVARDFSPAIRPRPRRRRTP